MYVIFVLGQLMDRPMTGYQLRAILTKIIGEREKVSFGTLYPLLQKLTDAGDITYQEAPAQNKRPQKIAMITAQGKQTFSKLMAAPVKPGKHETLEYLLKLKNLQHVSKTLGQSIIADFIHLNETISAEAQRNMAEIQAIAQLQPSEKHYALAITDFQARQADSALAWAANLRQEFEKNAQNEGQ